MFDFAALEAEFAKLQAYVADGVSLVNEVPAALDVAVKEVSTVGAALSGLKSSVAAATQAVTAAVAPASK